MSLAPSQTRLKMPEVTFKAKSDVTMAEKRKWVESQLPDDAAVERIYKRCMRTRVSPELAS